MALVLKDRVKETCTSPGTGTVTLLGASTGYSSFSTIGNANTTYYCIADQSGNNWEVGIGTYTASGTTLSRDTVLSNSLGTIAKINFSSGTQDVFVTYPSGRSVYADGATLTATNSSVLPIASGGTNSTATATAGGVGYGTGTAHAYTAVGTTGQALVSAGASAPAFGTLGIAGGGTNSTATATAGGVGYGTGTAHAYTTAGTSGQALVSAGASAPAFGTLGIAGGGTGQTSYTDGQLLIGNTTGNTLTKATLTAGSGISITNGSGSISIASSGGGGFSAMQVFTSSGTFTVPTGKTTVKVTVVGGGGGGTDGGSYPSGGEPGYTIYYNGAGGASGGTAIEYLTGLTPGGTVAVTIGGGGTGGSGGTGGTSSFGAYCSATGGSNSTGGSGSGGNINIGGANNQAWRGFSTLGSYGSGGLYGNGYDTSGAAGTAGVVTVEY